MIFTCCTYVSFGCTDPSFGSYDPQSFLDCNGYPSSNVIYTDPQTGVQSCEDINGNDQINNPNVSCWDLTVGLQCSNCVDSVTGQYDINLPDCTQQIFDLCGGDGFLTPSAWNDDDGYTTYFLVVWWW